MCLPNILRERVLPNIFQHILILNSSEGKESASLLPERHCEVSFLKGNAFKLCYFSIFQQFSKVGEVLLMLRITHRSSSYIESGFYMIEGHSIGECEADIISSELPL